MTTLAPARRPITGELLAAVPGTFRAEVVATEPGLVAGIALLDPVSVPVAVGQWTAQCADGDWVEAGQPIVAIVGTATEIGLAEDYVLGTLGYAAGLAKRARAIKLACPPGLEISCGGWKKLPATLKPALRAALTVAGVRPRLVDGDFVYMAKNTVTLLGGTAAAVRAGLACDHGPVAIQVIDIESAVTAYKLGARIVMVDNGCTHTLAAVNRELRQMNVRDDVVLAFGGGVTPSALAESFSAGADVVDVGRAILDAPLWDLRVQVHQ